MRLEWSRRRDIRHTIDAAIPSDEIILNHPLHPKQEVELTIIPEQINEVSGVELERKSAGPGSVGRPFSGRDDRVGEEMQILTSPDTCRADPDIAWERLKTLVRKPKELAVLIEIAAWREREAQSRGPRAQGRRHRRHRDPRSDYAGAAGVAAFLAARLRALQMGARTFSMPSPAGSPAIRPDYRRLSGRGRARTATPPWNC